MRKPAFCICKNKTQISCAVTTQLISAFVLAIQIVQPLFYLNPKFQASSYVLWLCSLVCVRPGRKPRRPVFSQRGSFNSIDSRVRCTDCSKISMSLLQKIHLSLNKKFQITQPTTKLLHPALIFQSIVRNLPFVCKNF